MTSIFQKIKPKESRPKRFLKIIWKGLRSFYQMFTFSKYKKEKNPRKLNIAIASILAIMGIFVVYRLSVASYNFIKDFEIKDLVFMMGEEVIKDENGYTNFLLLGRGGDGHDGPELTDTIIIASLDEKTQSVVMLSIPRDFYIRTEYYGSSRINEIARNVKNRLMYQKKYTEEEAQAEAINVLKKKVEDIVELDIHYYAMIDFNGFKSVVDALGGIDVNVERNIRDTTYPADTGWGYQVFSIKKGPQHLDGATALKYARSRHTTSDFDRAKRQQQVIQAIKDKALEMKTLTSPSKLKKLFASVDENFKSDLEFGEIITLAKIASKLPRENIISKVLVDEWTYEGGFLATPPRDQYGGAFVLIPYIGNMSEIHQYVRLLYKNREIYLENAKIEVQNGTHYGGIAGKIGTKLGRYSFNVINVTNTENKEKHEKSKIIIKNQKKFPRTSLILPVLIKGDVVIQTESTAIQEEVDTIEERLMDESEINEEADVIVILGSDYKNVTKKL